MNWLYSAFVKKQKIISSTTKFMHTNCKIIPISIRIPYTSAVPIDARNNAANKLIIFFESMRNIFTDSYFCKTDNFSV